MTLPRPEYPRPQLVRQNWLNLNGEWEFEIDNAMVGKAKRFYDRPHLAQTITVPFCPESRLSGIGDTDYMNCVWYRKEVEIPLEWADRSILLNIGASDYRTDVYVNGVHCGSHQGGYTPFALDISHALTGRKAVITLCVEDDVRSMLQPAGKQSAAYHSAGCFYTRTTGIWQTVFLEPVNRFYIQNFRITTDPTAGTVLLSIRLNQYAVGCRIQAEALFDGKPMGHTSTTVTGMTAELSISLAEKHLWDVGCGQLYDLALTVEYEGVVTDFVTSYFGLRSVALTERAFLLNGRPVFGRWVLDQGFYPDGIYTAPTDEALKQDIETSMRLGFNGARLHQKLFEPRFLYWADRLGYLVWGEYGNWGLNHTNLSSISSILPEWMEALERDFNHPSIIGWCPFNETWDQNGCQQSNDLIRLCYTVTKAIDPTRPVIDTSGNFHVGSSTDLYDIHDYEQDVASFAAHYENGSFESHPSRQRRNGQPYFVSEYGGIRWAQDDHGWGYGNAPKTEEEFLARYRGLTETLLKNPDCCGFCYTQLYDVEQEQNGLMTYDRVFKFDPDIIAAINRQKAAIED